MCLMSDVFFMSLASFLFFFQKSFFRFSLHFFEFFLRTLAENPIELRPNHLHGLLARLLDSRRLPNEHDNVVLVIHRRLMSACVCNCIVRIVSRYDLEIVLEDLHRLHRNSDPPGPIRSALIKVPSVSLHIIRNSGKALVVISLDERVLSQAQVVELLGLHGVTALSPFKVSGRTLSSYFKALCMIKMVPLALELVEVEVGD